MVARTPPKLPKKIAVPLNSTLLRETVNKVDKCMARLQELQYTVTGGKKVISGVSLSPRSTRGYLRTSLRCKQESLRIKNGTPGRPSPGKFPTHSEEWRRMSLPAMLVGETIGEIIKASQFAKELVESVAPKNNKSAGDNDPKTPVNRRRNPENSELRARRKREKQTKLKSMRSESNINTPSLQRAKSRINFKISPPRKRETERENSNGKYLALANRVSPKNRPWVKKTVIFPNPLFTTSPTSQNRGFSKPKSPGKIGKGKITTPHKFLIKSPTVSVSPTRSKIWGKKASPPKVSTAAKLRRSFSPSRLANKLVSPLKSRRMSVGKSDGEGVKMKMMMSGLKQRPGLGLTTPTQISARRM